MRRVLFALPAVIAVLIAACGGAPGTAGKPTVKIGSTNFSEQLILGELYGQMLEANGYTVERRFNLGNREIVHPALESGQIDMDVEYLATLLAFVDKNATPTTDARETHQRLNQALRAKNLTALDFAEAVDQNGFVVTKATADRLNLRRISDLAPVANTLVLGGPPECPQRPFCALGLERTYGIRFKEFKPLDVGGPLTVAALEGRQIDVGLLFTSDAAIAVKGFVLLEDDKKLQLADNVAPVVRNDLLERGGDEFRRLVNSVSAKLTTKELTDLNKEVGVERKEPRDVARAWLMRQGLLR